MNVCDADRVAKTGVACCEEHYPPAPKQRGRPKKDTGEMRCLDVRLTPISQQRPDFNKYFDFRDFPKVLICEEGGVGTDTKLHYHCYLETLRSDTFLTKLYAEICGGRGNKFYSSRQAHEGTEGYAIKDEVIVHHIGYTDKDLTDLVNKSRDYRKENETDRKRNGRQKEKYLAGILKEVAEGVQIHPSPSLEYIMGEILKCYNRDQKRFPPRATLENAVLTMWYKYDEEYVKRFYLKNLCI